MGAKCCEKSQSSNALVKENVTEMEIQIPYYTSNPDKEFAKIEGKYNLLRDLQFNDYIFMLSHFTMDTATITDDFSKAPSSYSKNESYYNESLDNDFFQSFIENKILKHPALYMKAGEDENKATIFKDILLQMHKGLNSKIEQHLFGDKPENKGNMLKKYHGMVYGLWYCSGKNINKICFLFNLFAEADRWTKSEELDMFLLALFLLPAYCALLARHKLGTKYEDIGKLEKDEMKSILDACEWKDSQNLVKVANGIIFENGESLNYEAWKSLFSKKENSLGWLLSPKGVRSMLEKNNV